jgi:hypothetical protein
MTFVSIPNAPRSKNHESSGERKLYFVQLHAALQEKIFLGMLNFFLARLRLSPTIPKQI